MSRPFRTFMVDPPWPEHGGGRIKRGVDRHYRTMKVSEMPTVILRSDVWRPARDAHLYLWATNNHLVKAGWLLEALGFTYVTCITWHKLSSSAGRHMGLGQYFRGETEHMLFGVRGRGYALRTARRDLTTYFEASVGKHSEKPQEAYDLVRQRSRGPYVEIFSRQDRPGWSVWGDEVACAA